jgi:hypothetical protein
MPKVRARNTIELSVSITPEMDEALKVATEFQGMKSSQYCRQALLMQLINQGFMVHPLQQRANAAQQRADAAQGRAA